MTRALDGVERDERMARYAEHSELRQVPDALRVADLLGDRLASARTVVDLGCGTGTLARHLARAAPRARVLGLDASRPRIAGLQDESDGARLDFAVHDLREPLPAEAHGADVITMTAVLHWLHPHEPEVVPRIAAALDPAGVAVLTTYHPESEASGLGGTDAVIAEAAGLPADRAAAAFGAAGIVGVSARTLPADELDSLLRRSFHVVSATAHEAVTAPADGRAFADYVDATFGDYYQALFPGHDAQRDAVATAAQRRLDATGRVTAMPVRTWLCTGPVDGDAP
ncbi:trans-aconitate 2-methyltransferase [Tsukamurella sp. 1534]|uniref:class I SAM-dependent methyltransferase n=1 Tax=Tsukamurella sp. 1534 TaxID=1151061 RepID=UPI0002F8585C|nr:class I SAM-dependent methyltransferase [Tsukamurella sp. 1534]